MAQGGPLISGNFVLASGSAVRARLLRNAGLDPLIDPADVDERTIESQCREDGRPTPDIAAALAEAKARVVAGRHPGGLVLGADQMLDCGGDVLNKPADMVGAAETLRRLQGRDHYLISAVCLVRDDTVLWCATDTARLRIRAMDAAAIATYLDRAGDSVLSSVGAYRLEDVGCQLFDSIEGDYFTVLGLPLLPVLAALRTLRDKPQGLMP